MLKPLLIATAVNALAWSAATAMTSCNHWSRTDTATKFAQEPFGTLAFEGPGGKYFVVSKNQCVLVNGKSNFHFSLNHNGAKYPDNSYAAVHVALIKVGTSRANTYLYRNRGDWDDDKGPFQREFDKTIQEFSTMAAGTQESFNNYYKDEGSRSWHDSVTSTDGRKTKYRTWDNTKTFITRREIIAAFNSGEISASNQNYLVQFQSRPSSNDLGNPPDFSFSMNGADCAFLRVSGSSNVSADFSGEYMININNNKTCNAIVDGLSSTSLIAFLFGN